MRTWTATNPAGRRRTPRPDQRLVSWLVDGGPRGEREILAYAAGTLIGIAVAIVVLGLVIGVSVVSG